MNRQSLLSEDRANDRRYTLNTSVRDDDDQ